MAQLPLIIAHRGESFDAPENTLASIGLAWERNDDAVEIDVQLSKDKHIVVIHDLNTLRLTGVKKWVKDQTLNELKKLDVGLWKDIQWKGEKIPTLIEVLETVPKGKKLIIEIKCDQAILPVLNEVLAKTDMGKDQLQFIGFDINIMSLTKKAFPDHKALWLLELNYSWIKRFFAPSLNTVIKEVKDNKLDGLNLWADSKMISRNLVKKVKSYGLLLYTWTVNDVEKAKDLMDWGVDAITTDGATWLSSHLMKN